MTLGGQNRHPAARFPNCDELPDRENTQSNYLSELRKGGPAVLVDLADRPRLEIDPAATIVVGAGAAGIALTERLAAAGRPVLLLESGSVRSTRPDEMAAELNLGSVSGLAYDGLTLGRARTLGGTTALWHGQVMRLHEIDLEHRPWIPGSGWPVALRELTPFYRVAEAWLGSSGRGYDASRWDEHPKLRPVAWDPAHLCHDFTEYIAKPMLGRVHRSVLANDPHVIAAGRATVSRVLLASDGRAHGVSGFCLDGTPFEFSAGSVVLAAGAVENARLLKLSDADGIGLGDGRWHTGRYLQDHPIVRMAEVQPRARRFLQDRYVALHQGRRRLFPKVRLSPELQRAEQLVDATAVFVHEHDEPGLEAARRLLLAARARRRPDAAGRDVLTAIGGSTPVLRDAYRRYVRGLSTGTAPSKIWVQLWLEQAPDPNSRITLGSGKDRFGLPQVNIDWRVGDLEIATSRRLTRLIGQDLRRLQIASLRELDAMHDDEAWRATVKDAYHPSGTTRMALCGRDGVVNPDLGVHGVPGLYILGGSVFPVGGYANPTLTIVALAMRLADRLASTREAR